VGCITGDKAERLLTDLSGYNITSANSGVVTKILEHLGRLLLTVSQAAFYIQETKLSFRDYLIKLHNKKRR
jgi:hypothetical protein